MDSAKDDDRQQTDNPYAAPVEDDVGAGLPPKVSVPLALVLLSIIIICFFINIGFGVGMLLIAAPAYVRALGISLQRASTGTTLSTGERIVSFIGSMAVVVVCCVAGGLAFFATCLTGVLFDWGTVGGEILAVSFIGFLTASAVIYWACWPKRRNR